VWQGGLLSPLYYKAYRVRPLVGGCDVNRGREAPEMWTRVRAVIWVGAARFRAERTDFPALGAFEDWFLGDLRAIP